MANYSYETHGRRLLVEFKCYRCKTTATRTLKECEKDSQECFRDLYDLHPPSEWKDGGFYYPLFCPECAKKYERFMNGEELQQCPKDT